jgi:hypothetical protein
MPTSRALAALRAAILEERLTQSDAHMVLTRYDDFVQQLAAFHGGTGPVPTTEEFALWRKDVCLVRAVRKMTAQGGAAPDTDGLHSGHGPAAQ